MKPIKNILITRPDEQGKALAEQCRALNYHVTLLPLVKITPVFIDPLPINSSKQNYDIVIFISPNAIKYGLSLVQQSINYQSIAVIGKGSLQLLQSKQINADIVPENDYTSEGLLQNPQLQKVENKTVLIVRGCGGREKLKNTLEARGAVVTYYEVYKRDAIEYSATDITKLSETNIDLVQVSNQQSLLLLMPLIKNANWLKFCQWWLLSKRTKTSCIQYGIKESMCHLIQPGNDHFIKLL